MSLVVAQITETGICIVSDTRVSFADQRRPSFKTGTLKAIVVNARLVICFAGDVQAGLGSIRRCAKELNLGHSLEHLKDALCVATKSAKESVEFIVAEASSPVVLTRIRDGVVESKLQSVWIGDHKAFERFQRARHEPSQWSQEGLTSLLTPGQITMLTLGHAMDSVIKDATVPSVDDFCVRIAAKDGEFNYLEESFFHVGRDITVGPEENLIARMIQSVEEGGYSVSVVQPANAGTAALGLSFPRARLAMIYLPLVYDEAQVVQDVSPREFSTIMYEKYGIEFSDPGLR
jgi:hypothetical protein